MFTLNVLGPAVLLADGRPLRLATQKALALLVLLALEGPGHRARLSAWLWPALGESEARRNLRRELARLRQAGAAAAVLAEGEQLLLAPGVAIDAALFEQALNAGQPEAALALWRGAPADGFQLDDAPAFDDWLAACRTRLAALRRRALAASAAALEAAGQAEAALQHVLTLLADDPLQEAQHRQAMRLLAVCGRREAAIAQYEQCRALLAAELGLAPMAETEALLASLRGPVPAAPVAPAANPAATTWPRQLPLVGREAEVAALQAAWDQGHTLLLEGEAGVGKTRLAHHFAAAQGAYALAQCRGGDRDVPYASFTRALRCLAGEALARAELPAWVQRELSRVLPELGTAPAPIGSAEERRRFFEACAAAWLALAAGSFDAVVVDDWHLADAASRALFGFIVQQRAESPAGGPREIFVYRPELDDHSRATLAAWVESGQATQLRLAPLASAGVLELVRRLSGAADPRRFAARLARATGGNPFFLAETLRHWLALQLLSVGADGVWQTPFDDHTADYRELPVPDSVRSAVLARVRRLPDATRRLLEAAALAAEPFSPALLAGACALSEVEALAAIEEGAQAQLLREREGGYAFAHDLVQLALESALAPERRRLVHRRLALGAEAAALPPTEAARHWEAGGEPQRAVAHRIAAAEAAMALYADADAELHWAAALADGATLAQRVRILRRRWGLLRMHDDGPGLDAALAEFDHLRQQALAAGGLPGMPEAAQECAVEAAQIMSLTNRPAEALQRIDEALHAGLPPGARRAKAMTVRTQALNGLGRTEEAMAVAEATLAEGGMSADQEAMLRHALVYTCFLRSEPRRALGHARRTLVLWESIGSRRSVARAHANIGLLLGGLDEQQACIDALQQAYAIGAELRMVEMQREVANNLAYAHLHLGAPQRAVEVVQAAWHLAPSFSRSAIPVFFLGMLVQAHCQLGQLGAALDHAEDAHARALVLNDLNSLVDCASMALDLCTFIGDGDTAARLLASLEGLPLEGLAHFRVKLAFNLVFRAVAAGELAEAHRHLADIGDVQALQQPADQAQARLRHAQVALAAGDAQAALAWLAPLRGAALHVETWALACATRLAAGAALGHDDPADLAAADEALASGRLPAPPALQLRLERLRAAQRGGDSSTAVALQAAIGAERQRLAASLHGHPRQQQQFLQRWA